MSVDILPHRAYLYISYDYYSAKRLLIYVELIDLPSVSTAVQPFGPCRLFQFYNPIYSR
jgi:hypothetical protein